MALQNRVAPDGSLHATTARGLLTGNRGILHDPDTKTLTGRRWTAKAWIACALQYRDRPPREVWGRQIRGERPGWTELFFLDEVTALAAGHRPCFECRRAEAKSFLECARAGLGRPDLRAPEIDALLHAERRLSSKAPRPVLSRSQLLALPDAAVVETASGFFAIRHGNALPWRHGGYGKPVARAVLANDATSLVTPPTVISALRAGYRPLWHPSAS
jgi:hypothetical protein